MRAAEFSVGDDLSSCISVDILDDDTYESPESFSAGISGSTVGTLTVGSPSSATVEIGDPEGMYAYW